MKLKPTRRISFASMETHKAKARSLTLSPGDLSLRKILVPIDFSELSEKALHYGSALAQQFSAEMFLVHVVQPLRLVTTEFGFAAPAACDIRPLQQEAAQRISAWRKAIDLSVPVLTLVRTGESAREIVTAARDCDCDLIVIGTHGRTGLDRMLMGSTGERVVRFAPCPVLVVRGHERDFIRPVAAREQHSHGLKARRGKARHHGKLL